MISKEINQVFQSPRDHSSQLHPRVWGQAEPALQAHWQKKKRSLAKQWDKCIIQSKKKQLCN